MYDIDFGPCYHMSEVVPNLHVSLWNKYTFTKDLSYLQSILKVYILYNI